MSNKLRIKHLTENNTRESIPGEMIVSNVTGHISVRDNYFVNSATKDILGRIDALNKLHNHINNDIDKMFNKINEYDIEFRVYNESLTDDNFIENYNAIETAYLENSSETPTIDMWKSLTDLDTNVKTNIDNRITALENLATAEDLLTEAIHFYEKLAAMNQYLIEQQHVFEKYLEELKDDFEYSKVNYEELYDRYVIFKKYIDGKYKRLTREFEITFTYGEGGVLTNE